MDAGGGSILLIGFTIYCVWSGKGGVGSVGRVGKVGKVGKVGG